MSVPDKDPEEEDKKQEHPNRASYEEEDLGSVQYSVFLEEDLGSVQYSVFLEEDLGSVQYSVFLEEDLGSVQYSAFLEEDWGSVQYSVVLRSRPGKRPTSEHLQTESHSIINTMGKLEALVALLCFALLVSTSFAMPVEDEEERDMQRRFVWTTAALVAIGVTAGASLLRD
ncbi:hypothetical protein PoB_004468700 [Plakobranchus ocellatus]|uniref:Uncharacterized protein n=1 Tax=Plakobranchus ocellatus TaxID=259542 RepID=A0AAV4BGU2_9GAST|nr:hypothetical protein PoB_004468700 [Plakobranchus ocellatus]